MKSLRYFIILVSLFAFGMSSMQAQNPAANPAVMAMVNQELSKRGLAEADVRARLLQEGINVDAIQPAEIPNYQGRVTAILDQMQNEKKANVAPVTVNVEAAPQTGTGTVASTTTPTDAPVAKTDLPQTTVQEAAAEAQQRIIQANAAQVNNNIYGHSLFTGKSLDVFRTTDGAEAPDTYVLGEGDEIHITIFGASQTDIQQRIKSDGSIQPSGVAKIFLKGLTLAQARELIKKQLSSSYLFRGDQIAVTIISARTIMVNVFGEVVTTGSFTLSALNSAFNALSAAGGPTGIGSVRNIQLIRGNNKKDIDLYEFMNDPSAQFKLDLQNNDIIYVPVQKLLVSLEGAVKRPMRYELKEGESLSDLIQFAGGVNVDVYPDFVQIKRYVNGEEKLFEWNLADVLKGKTTVKMQNGDVVSIKNITKPIESFVDIQGSVYYPGRYDLFKSATLGALLKQAQPTFQAKTDVVFVERTRPDQTIEFITLPTAGNEQFPMKERDVIRVMDLTSYRDIAQIAVNGQVRKPFTRDFALNDRMTIAQAIEYAGGLKTTVYPVAYIFRKNLFNPKEIKYIVVNLEKDGEMQLQPGDQLNVYDNTTYSNVGEIRISGAVKNPSAYTFDASMSLHDLLTNGGGFNVGAAYNRVQVFRANLSASESTKIETITLEVDSSYNLVEPKGFTLQPYDHVVVRMVPEFTMGRSVELNGQVKYPGVYVLESKETTLADVIKRAGGLLNDADPNNTRMFRTYNGRGNIVMNAIRAVRNPSSYRHNPVLFEGDVININRMENTVTILEPGTRMAQYSINIESHQIKNVVYQGKKSAKWYINQYAGGMVKNADRKSLTVTLPNNQMKTTKSFLFFKNYPTVEPGSVISLKMDEERIKNELEPKEKMDIETTLSKGLATMTSTLSLILLLQRL